MGPLNATVLVLCVVALVRELSGFLPGRLLAPVVAPPEIGPGRADWQAYVLLPAFLRDGQSTEPVDRAIGALLSAHPSVQVVVIDRGTPGPVTARSDRVAVVHVTGPDDVDNTAAFLNAGLDVVLHDVQRRGLDPARVVVGVVDVATRLPGPALEIVVEALQDPVIGAVQLAARPTPRSIADLSNRELTAWAAAAVPAGRRSWFGAPSHPPIGQLYRLSALLQVDERPWWTTVPAGETDLALSLHVDGWRLPTADDLVAVVPPERDLRAVLAARTRSLHAGLHATTRLGELWRSKAIDNETLVRVTARIVSHWLLTAASLYLALGAGQLLLATVRGDLGRLGLAPVVLVGYVASRAAVLLAALVPAARLRLTAGREPAIALGLALASPISVIANLRALGRVVFRLGGYVGVDEVKISGIALAVARTARTVPTTADLPDGPVRLRARLHEAQRRPRRRR